MKQPILIETIEDMISFIENHNMTTDEVNKLLSNLKPSCLFIYDHSPEERGKILRKHLSKPEWGIFVDCGDLGVVE